MGRTTRQRQKGNELKCSEDQWDDVLGTQRSLRWMQKNQEERRGQSPLLHQRRKQITRTGSAGAKVYNQKMHHSLSTSINWESLLLLLW